MHAPSLARALGLTSVGDVAMLEDPPPLDARGWSRHLRPGGVELVSGDGEAMVRITEHARPPDDGLVAREAMAFAARLGAAPTEHRVVITRVGEVAALLWGPASDGEATAGRAWVLGEDAHVELGAVGRAAHAVTLRTIVLHLLHEVSFAGGPVRLRRALHDPPRGWRAEARGLHVDYWAPDGDGLLTVAPACPLARHDVARWDRLLHAPLSDDEEDAEVVTVDSSAFRYTFRLEGAPQQRTAHRAVLEQVVRSLRPIGAAPPPLEPSAFAAWVD